jgi:UDP-glucose 4-epimerase
VKKLALVTGCAGFIGSHMTEYLLDKNIKVIGVDNLSSGSINNIKNINSKKFKFYNIDVKYIAKILKNIKKLDFVFHFSGNGELIPSIEQPKKYFENNSLNTVNLIEEIRAKKFKLKKFIYAASSTCYGINKKITDENAKINLEHPYALSKYVGELSCLHWGKVFNIPVISIRIFNAYGPRSRTSGVYGAVIGVFLKQKIEDYPLTIVGNGNQKRDFLHVEDLCRAFYKAAISSYKNEIFNLGYGKAKTINYLASLISNNHTFIPWRAGEPIKTEANICKIKKFLNWKPRINLKNGIAIVLKNIEYWKEAPLWTKQKISKATKNWNKFLSK